MYEEYEARRPGHRRGERMEVVTVRLPEGWKDKLAAFAAFEGDTLSGLVQEGVLRALDARDGDPDYRPRHRAAAEARLAQLATETALLQQLLEQPSESE